MPRRSQIADMLILCIILLLLVACASDQGEPPLSNDLANIIDQLPPPFGNYIANQDPIFLGDFLGGPCVATDGNLEVAFENLVYYTTPDNPNMVYARPVMEESGFSKEPLAEPLNDPLMRFYPLEGRLGHNIPILFDEYIQKHGGYIISGPPISEIFTIDGSTFRQCFANLCLDLNQKEPEERRLKPAPMGVKHTGCSVHQTDEGAGSQAFENLIMRVWEERKYVPAKKEQIIYVAIFNGKSPLKNQEPVLSVTLPDGTQGEYLFPPTDERGVTFLEVPPITAPNGTLIAYQVCLNNIGGENYCVGDNYLIWDYP